MQLLLHMLISPFKNLHMYTIMYIIIVLYQSLFTCIHIFYSLFLYICFHIKITSNFPWLKWDVLEFLLVYFCWLQTLFFPENVLFCFGFWKLWGRIIFKLEISFQLKVPTWHVTYGKLNISMGLDLFEYLCAFWCYEVFEVSRGNPFSLS